MSYNLNESKNKPMAERVIDLPSSQTLGKSITLRYNFFKKKAAMALLTLT